MSATTSTRLRPLELLYEAPLLPELDLSRDLLESGELARLVREDAVVETLETEAVEKFVGSLSELLAGLEAKRAALAATPVARR